MPWDWPDCWCGKCCCGIDDLRCHGCGCFAERLYGYASHRGNLTLCMYCIQCAESGEKLYGEGLRERREELRERRIEHFRTQFAEGIYRTKSLCLTASRNSNSLLVNATSRTILHRAERIVGGETTDYIGSTWNTVNGWLYRICALDLAWTSAPAGVTRLTSTNVAPISQARPKRKPSGVPASSTDWVDGFDWRRDPTSGVAGVDWRRPDPADR